MFKGKCLCGAVSYSSSGPAVFMGNCYCVDCRRESGTGHITAVAVPSATLVVDGATAAFAKPTDSGSHIHNSFCPVCATTLFTNPDNLPGLMLIRAGTLDDVSAVVPQMNMYVAVAPAWDVPPANIPGFPAMAPAA